MEDILNNRYYRIKLKNSSSSEKRIVVYLDWKWAGVARAVLVSPSDSGGSVFTTTAMISCGSSTKRSSADIGLNFGRH